MKLITDKVQINRIPLNFANGKQNTKAKKRKNK